MPYKQKPDFNQIHRAMENSFYIPYGINRHSTGKSGRSRNIPPNPTPNEKNVKIHNKKKIKARRKMKKLARKVSRR